MSILKLKAAGEKATLTIAKCEVVDGQFGQQIRFTANNGDILYIGKDSADPPLVRLGFGDGDGVHYDEVVGHSIHFSRVANTKKPGAAPWWDLELATPADLKPQAPTKRLTEVPGEAPALVPDRPQGSVGTAKASSSPVEARSRRQVAEAYKWSLKTAHDALYALDTEVTNVDMAVVQAGAATLLIALDKTGLLFQPPSLAEVAEALDLKPVKRVPPPEDEDNQPW